MIDPVAAEHAADRADSPAAATDLLRPAFRRHLTPTWLSATTLLAGHRPLEPDRPLRVLDLHGGAGVTAAVIAAAHPDAQVWVVDDRAANVERADRLATSAGLSNVTVLEACSTDAALPSSVDIALLDDIVSTTDDAGRAQLTTIIRRHVRPGGLVVVGYRARVGWSEIVPLRCMALLFARAGQPPAEWQRRAIVDMLERLRACKAPYVVDRPTVMALVELAASMDCEELADVLLTDHLEPMAFADVAEWLAPAGASSVGSALLGDLDVDADSPLGDLLDDTRDEPLREAFRDLVSRPTSRIDVFRRGTARPSTEETSAMLMELELVALGAGRAADDDVVAGAVERLGDGSATVGDLVASGTVGPRRVDHLVSALLGRGLAHPRAAGWGAADAVTACCALNRCLADPELTPAASVLASAVIGSAIPVSSADPGDPATGALLARLGIGGHA